MLSTNSNSNSNNNKNFTQNKKIQREDAIDETDNNTKYIDKH
jgi:hypothetical protein